MRGLWKPGGFERGGNTKTHGMIRGEFIVHDDIPPDHEGRHLREAADLSHVGALLWPGAVRHARHRRHRVHEHQPQADGRARPEADERREVHDGHDGGVDADLRHAQHGCECAAAGAEPQERADVLLHQPAPLARARSDHAGALDQDAEQSVRGAVLQLRAVPHGRRPGDDVLGVAEDEQADEDPTAAVPSPRRLFAAGDGRRL